MMMKPIFLVFAITAGCVTAGGFYAATVQKGVTKERARVEIQAQKTHVKAQKARAAVATRPASSVLDGQFRD